MSTTPETTTVTQETTTADLRSYIQDKSLANTTKVTGTFLEAFDLIQFRKSGKFAADACKSDMAKWKKLSEELLQPVFNADPEKVAEYFLQPNAKKEIVLAKTCYREGYHSKKQDKFVVFRNWKSVSALQAAALCLDKFLVIKLLAYIVGNDNLRLEAKKQLEEIRNRIVKETKEKQETVNSVAKATSASSEKVTNVSSEANDSSKGDRKEVHENVAHTACADLSEYGAPIQALLKAYKDFLTQYPLLSSQNKWGELDKLWDVVGSCHKRLPRYVLQEIFKDKRWVDDSDFTVEPPRCELRYWNNNLLDLDGLGDGTLFGLYKCVAACWRAQAFVGCVLGRCAGVAAQIDSAALSHLYELRLVDLEKIIVALEAPESALALIASDKGLGFKQS